MNHFVGKVKEHNLFKMEIVVIRILGGDLFAKSNNVWNIRFASLGAY